MARGAPTTRILVRLARLRGGACSALATTLSLASGAAFGDAPGRNDVFIRGITAKGTGCPAGSVSASVSEDGAAFTVISSQHLVELGPGGGLMTVDSADGELAERYELGWRRCH